MVGNMYRGVVSINCLRGRCEIECLYCTSHHLRKVYPNCNKKYNGEYKLDHYTLNKSWGKNKQIFVCGQNDLFASGVSNDIIDTILKKCRDSDSSNLYMFQTKNPLRYQFFIDKFPKKFMLGVTIETNREEYIKEFSNAPSIDSRVKAMVWLTGLDRYITVEPAFDHDHEEFLLMFMKIRPEKVYIGADSKVYKYPKIYNNLKLPEPSSEKLEKLIFQIRKFTEVEVKSNLNRIL